MLVHGKLEIFEENEPVNLYFLRLKARGNGKFIACVLKTPLPGQIPTSCWRHVFTFATVHATDADVTFYDGPRMHTVKAATQAYNSTWIALLKHGLVLVKTCLLIACDTCFYAIMRVINVRNTCIINASVTVKPLAGLAQCNGGKFKESEGYSCFFIVFFFFFFFCVCVCVRIAKGQL